jgi:hypothetical protein
MDAAGLHACQPASMPKKKDVKTGKTNNYPKAEPLLAAAAAAVAGPARCH